MRLGNELRLEGRETIALEHGALLHDIGKIGVPDAILLKRGGLTDDEWVQMRQHVDYGVQIVRGIDFLEGAAQVVGQHHERFDGSGYPRGLVGDRICVGARIFAVADAVDAITSDRPYRAGRPFEAAIDELLRCSGQHFDPMVVNAFTAVPMDVWREIRQLANEPGLSIQIQKTGQEISYSRLALDGERLLGEWARNKQRDNNLTKDEL
jgi:putative nucleotidyltransferase with HDIG domain